MRHLDRQITGARATRLYSKAVSVLFAAALIVSGFGVSAAFATDDPGGAGPTPTTGAKEDSRTHDASGPEPIFVFQLPSATAARSARAALSVGTVTGSRYLALKKSDYEKQKDNPLLAGLVPERAVIMQPTAFGTDDPQGAAQWSLGSTAGTSGIRWKEARDLGLTLLKTPRVAVLDTGWTAHPDLPTPVAEYDFVSDLDVANDGNARDSDARDPGNRCSYTSSDSDWHGTATAGQIAAKNNNGIGLIGVLPSVNLVIGRVLGVCGGVDFDIADGIRWAAGGSVAGVPAITKVDVINMSLGGYGTCNSYVQEAITFARSQGVVVVAAAGNDTDDATRHSPVGCLGVLGVGATNKTPSLTSYSNYGGNVALLAPGGDDTRANTIPLLSNSGTTGPLEAAYDLDYGVGTSFAAPYVAAAAAYLRAVAPSLTPSQIAYLLESTATPVNSGECATPRTCGAGMLNLEAALSAASSAPTLEADLAITPVTAISSVTRNGSAAAQVYRFGTGVYQFSGTKVTFYSSTGAACSLTEYCWTQMNWSAPLPQAPIVNLSVSITGGVPCGYYWQTHSWLAYDDNGDGYVFDNMFSAAYNLEIPSYCNFSTLWVTPYGDVAGLDTNGKAWVVAETIERSGGESAMFVTSVKFDFSTTNYKPVWGAPPAVRSGGSAVGSQFSAIPGAWGPGTTLTYQWRRCTPGAAASTCSNISGAKSTTYTAVSADLGKTIRLEVTGASSGGSSKWVTPATATISSPPVNTVAPKVTGTTKVGSLLTGSTGTWTGNPTPTYSYVWARCSASATAASTLPGTCALISGAINPTYSSTADDYNSYLRVGVTGTNGAGSATMYSATTAVIAGGMPANTSVPTIAGTAKLNVQLTASPGTWSGYPVPSETYAYAWFSCTRTGAASATTPSGCTAISTATTRYFTVTSAQVGKFLRVRVTATSSAGSTAYFSATTAKAVL